MAVTGTSQLKVLVDGGDDVRQLVADWLNGTGAASDIGTVAATLLRNLFMTGLARPDALRLGMAANPRGAILDRSGGASEILFTLGPPLCGLWYETTAIPEIRDQAAALAQQLISDRRLSRRPGSAA
jgi:uncharacterized NAD(P)/FAD-binding protein YdhS